ncbi:MAG TPA: ABC transporter substrate-binding protein [Streptosporangiaceae bacterium]|nr:ABC transporter substrate-binding protein [Streptosporangiaceae bacterium]
MNPGRRKRRFAGMAAVAIAALLAAACSSSSAPPSSSGGTKVTGGTATWALPPSTTPNWIWPFTPITNYSVYNAQTFQWLMYRPLYMFGGNNSSISVNYPLSTANAPVYSNGGKTVTITMKGWKWSNGETVDASDVVFWLNMMEAEKANYAGYAPGTMPDNLVSFKGSGNTVTLQLDKAYSSYWFTYNQLAEITPMPAAWDVTKLGAAGGSGGCATDTAADKWAKCKAVYNFLVAQTKDTSTYASSPIWAVVDGPWKLSFFNTSGNVTFVPNPKYSGSPKPTLAQFKQVPYTDDSTEYTALKTNGIDVGYIPSADTPQKPAGSAVPATNPLGSGYTLQPLYSYGIFYYQPNFNNPTFGAVFKQLYIRQALQETVDQPGMDNAIYRGYSVPTSGGVPTVPTNQWTPSIQRENNGQGPYPFSVSNATSLLTSHGWSKVNGVMTCQKAGTGSGQCGAGIAKGTAFKFTLDWATGQASTQQQVAVYKSDASKAGIDINLVGQSFNTIIGESTPCKPGPKCTWDALMYGGWLFNGPGFQPTGEPLFQTGAGSNSGSYSNSQMDSLIGQTHTSSSLNVFHNYATYLAQQLPYIWMPNAYAIQAVNSKLHNVTFNSLDTLLPEYWYFTK